MTITRTADPGLVATAIAEYPVQGLNIPEWVANPANVALTNNEGDVSLFERQWRKPNTVCGHYFFKSRGKEALEVAQAMLKQIFTGSYDIDVIIGLTPVEHKGALGMNKRLGFTSHGQIDTASGPCEFVLLTKTEWENMNE